MILSNRNPIRKNPGRIGFIPSKVPFFCFSNFSNIESIGSIEVRPVDEKQPKIGCLHPWDSLLALTRQNGAAKAPSIGTAPIQRRRLFSLKEHRIDGFPPPVLPEKIAERECRRAKTASRKCSSSGRGHFNAFFFQRKKLQTSGKNKNLKHGLGRTGIWRSRLRSRSKRGETQKTEILGGRRSENNFLKEKQKIL